MYLIHRSRSRHLRVALIANYSHLHPCVSIAVWRSGERKGKENGMEIRSRENWIKHTWCFGGKLAPKRESSSSASYSLDIVLAASFNSLYMLIKMGMRPIIPQCIRSMQLIHYRQQTYRVCRDFQHYSNVNQARNYVQRFTNSHRAQYCVPSFDCIRSTAFNDIQRLTKPTPTHIVHTKLTKLTTTRRGGKLRVIQPNPLHWKLIVF